jgi:predicted O-methyltransferase YrrM
VCFLDDDTTMHPEYLRRMAEAVKTAGAVVVAQQRQNGMVLTAAQEHLKVGAVDIGQAFISRPLIGTHRIPEHYEGDGVFLQAVLAGHYFVTYLPDILSEHNALEAVAA